MTTKLITALAIATTATISFAIGSPSEAQERNNVYAPFNCNFESIPCRDVGESRLLRTDDGISVNIVTSRLKKGHTYTVWWVVFNNPSACSPPGCGEDDLGSEPVNATVLWATGGVIAESGDDDDDGGRTGGDFTAHLNEGEKPFPEDGGFQLPGDDDGLLDAKNAEIHIVLRSHGPVIKRKLAEQITSFNGGCRKDVGPRTPKRKGECADIQFAVHAP